MNQKNLASPSAIRAPFHPLWLALLCSSLLFVSSPIGLAQLPAVSDSRLGVDCLKLTSGKRFYGFLLEQDQSGGTFAVERTWLATTYADYLATLEAAEKKKQENAAQAKISRLQDWIIDLDESVLKRFLESEATRIEQSTQPKNQKTQFIVVDFDKQEVRDLKMARSELRHIAGLAFREKLDDVTITPASYLRRELVDANIDINNEKVDLLDRLPFSNSETPRQWAAKQALIEFAFGRELEFQGTGDLLVKKGDDANIGQLLSQAMGNNSANMIQRLGADLGLPEFAKFSQKADSDAWKTKVISTAEEGEFRGALVSRLDQNLMSSKVQVLVTFLAKAEDGSWFEAFEYTAKADTRNQSAERIQRIKDDPQVQQLLGMVQGLGLSSRLDQALKHGAATQQALRNGQAKFNEFLTRFGSRVDDPGIPGL